MPGKPKPWRAVPRTAGLQARTYGTRQVYRFRQRHRGRLYVDYFGEMSLITAVRLA